MPVRLAHLSKIPKERRQGDALKISFHKRIHQPSVNKCLAGTLGPQSVPHNKRTGFTQLNSMHCFVVIELIVHNAEVRQRVTCPHLASSNQSKPQPPKLNNSCLTHRIQLSVHSSLCLDLLHAPCIHVSNTSGSTINQFLHAIKVWIFSVKCYPFSFVTRSLKTRTKMHKERPQKIA